MAAVSETKKIVSKIIPGRKHHQEADSDDPQTVEDVIQIVVNRMTQRIAARMVNTNERVEALLARGAAYDENNRYALAGQWTKFVEALETMPPLPDPEDDSYRLYNIGVGDEALGYKAETPASAKRYFEQAVVQYRKAGESNPHEKYFIEPVNRIEVALEHYKKLSTAAPAPTKAATKAKTK
jgi:tetratricopeptide (TPR) repeat protein